ncbi:MAG: tRNA (N(6)-L-threonylcarbamoyladenosine(37)-C(2))-methylthiotransferase MtaB [Candidatus Riflebacteria bacterium]|nr:tRNA (N(6)-L-threonylcarbamoyladenosine(37)-C(2))-methylthiotransferase MtaB [Candidatus Riflebacteria bacterium]
MQSFYLESFGCKVSYYDGEKLAATISEFGLKRVLATEIPDLVIINGCAVTGRASQKVRQSLRSAKRTWPDAKILLAGCEARRAQIQSTDQAFGTESHQEYELIDTNSTKEQIREILTKLGFDCNRSENQFHENTFPIFERTRAFLKIQDGCSHFCTYCIVPFLRGKEYSKPLAESITEASKIALSGKKEIVLTGIHLGKYEFGLTHLLREFDNNEPLQGIERIRLSSIEPLEINDDLLSWMAESPKACHHLHIPLQSGSSEVLKRMNRPYDTRTFSTIVEKARKLIPGIAITTDLIVGFPGEKDAEFDETTNFLREISFSRIHIFRFSPRNGTPAANFPDQIPASVKQQRSKAVEEIWKNSALKFHQSFIGKKIEVLWEFQANHHWEGFSREYIRCVMPETFSKEDYSNSINIVEAVSADEKQLKTIS